MGWGLLTVILFPKPTAGATSWAHRPLEVRPQSSPPPGSPGPPALNEALTVASGPEGLPSSPLQGPQIHRGAVSVQAAGGQTQCRVSSWFSHHGKTRGSDCKTGFKFSEADTEVSVPKQLFWGGWGDSPRGLLSNGLHFYFPFCFFL